MDQSNDISKTVGELLLLDVFTRHGISKEKRRDLTPEQKTEIKKLVADLKSQTEAFLNNSRTTKSVDAEPVDSVGSTSTPEETEMSDVRVTSKPFISNTSNSKPHKKRLTLRKRTES